MILVTPGGALSLRDLQNNADRLGIRQFGGGVRLQKPSVKPGATGFRGAADPPVLLLDAICIFPLSLRRISEAEEAVARCLSFLSPRENPPADAVIVLAGMKHIPEFLNRRLEKYKIPVLSSIYDEYLLESRLVGLIREQKEQCTTLSGGLVNVEDAGVLITGESGLGKTSCALELIKRGHSWVADDVILVERRSDSLLYGRGYEGVAPLLEIKGRGIVRAEEVMGASSILCESRIDFVLEFVEAKERKNRKGRGGDKELMGVRLPYLALPVSGDAWNMAGKVEACVRILRSKIQRQLQRRPDGREKGDLSA